ncbi:hypothetical protein ACFE04_012742 [Oxalis oulophora]
MAQTNQQSKFTIPMNDLGQQPTQTLDLDQTDYSKRNNERRDERVEEGRVAKHDGIEDGEEISLPNPLQAAAASALAFSVGAMVPLLAASFIRDYKVRLGVVVAAVTLALVIFGWLGAILGKASPVKSSLRVLIGGWLAMVITFGLTKLIGSSGL